MSVLSIQLTSEQAERLGFLADSQGRTLAEQAAHLITESLDAQDECADDWKERF